ncbi:WxL protein peptidoglycan domain-containing protein [Nonomuraea jiangxiensis]|nr:DUF916 domain-containing protein [Nonomuraea jiangxiensis]
MLRTLPRPLAVLAAVLVTLLVTVLVTVPVPAAGAVAEPAKPTLTWSVQPADQQGPDGRRRIELTLDPGQVVTEHLAVRNFSDGTAVFALKAADGYLTDKGRFNMLPSDRASADGGTWIQVQEQVTVGANETKVVPFTITVPRDATPGDHPAGIAATVTSTQGTVAVEGRVGFRVMMRATGTVRAAVAVDDLTATYEHSWNPFSAGTIRVTYTAKSAGNVAVTGAARVTVAELFGLAEHHARADVQEMFPGGSREVGARVEGVWALGPLRTSVDVTPATRDGAAARPVSATVTVWTLPWPQLALAAILAALVLAVRAIIRRRTKRLADLLARAREEGRAEAKTGGHPGGTIAGERPANA